MTRENQIAILKDKINRLENSVKNTKCPGVLKKLHRQLRNLEASEG